MKAIKRIMIVFAIFGIIFELFFIGMKKVVNEEYIKMTVSHTSQICEVSQVDGSYTYTLGDTTYSEEECIDMMGKAKTVFDVLVVVQGVLIGFYIITATEAGRAVKKRQQLAQPAIC